MNRVTPYEALQRLSSAQQQGMALVAAKKKEEAAAKPRHTEKEKE